MRAAWHPCQPAQSSCAAVAFLKTTTRASVDCRIGMGQSHVFVAKRLTISQCVLFYKNRNMSGFGSSVDHSSGHTGSCFRLWLCSSPGLCPPLAPGRGPAQMVGVTGNNRACSWLPCPPSLNPAHPSWFGPLSCALQAAARPAESPCA